MSVKKASSSLVSRSRVGFTPTGGGAAVTISNVIVTDSSWNNLDDTAVGTSSSYIKIIGSGFVVNPSVYIGTTQVSSGNITFVSSTELRVVLPSLSLGTQNLFVFNTDYSGAIWSAGLVVSGFPDFTQTTYTSSTPLSVSVQLVATGDAPLTYALQGGSSLPAGTTLSSSGLITGTTTDGTYQFTVILSDAQNQSFQQQLTLTITSADEYFNRTTLAINADVDTFVRDASTNSFPITINGDTKPSEFSPYNTNWSNYFNGTSDKLNIADSTNFTFTGAFTVECWVYFLSGTLTYACVLGGHNSTSATWGMYIKNSNSYASFFVNGTLVETTTAVPSNQWTHIAATRDNSNVVRVFINGTNGTTSPTVSGTIETPSGGLNIGRDLDVNGYFGGYISNIRVVKDNALYTSNFTPPTSALTAIANTSLLTCQSNRFIDNSTNAFTITKVGDTKVSAFGPFTETDITTGSGYFDGTGDYLSVASGSTLAFGASSDFTIEGWYYPTAYSANTNTILSTTTGDSASVTAVNINVSTSGEMLIGGSYGTGAGTVPLNTWTHFVVTRISGILKIFLNGVERVSSANTSNFTSTGCLIGGRYAGATYYVTAAAYISNIRIVPGTGVTSVTVPSSPLTAVANTSLLTLQGRRALNNHTFIDVSGNNNLITRNGNATQGSFSPFSPAGWSNYFDGTGDYLQMPVSSAFAFENGNFTIETWIYPTGGATKQYIIGNVFNSNDGDSALAIYLGSSNEIIFQTWFTILSTSSNSVVTKNTWNHIAAVRSGTTISVFVNGTRVNTFSNSSNFSRTTGYQIGMEGTASSPYTGYVSNARVVKGTAIYNAESTTIIVPTTSLTSVTNTSLLTCQSNRFIDNSTNNFTITKNGDTKVVNFSPFKPTAVYSPGTHGGSAYFDGTGDYLRATAQTFSGNFTLECWIYPFRLADTQNVGEIFATVSPNTQFYVNNSGQLGYYNTSTSTLSSANAIVTNTWQHIAICRSGTTTRLFVNGQVVATNSSDSGNRIFTDIGTFADGLAYYFQGYISDARWVTKDLYTSAFTLPAAPLTKIVGTNLFLNFNSGGIIDSTSRNVLENNNAVLVTSTKKFGSGSIYTGTSGSNYLRLPISPFFIFGTENFTIEGWFYPTGTGTERTFFMHGVNTAGGLALFCGTGGVRFRSSGQTDLLYATTISNSSFTHIAFVRDGNTRRIFINGTQVASDTLSFNVSDNVFTDIGASPQNASDSFRYYGYIDDFRITKFARYTANFTPPTSTFLVQ